MASLAPTTRKAHVFQLSVPGENPQKITVNLEAAIRMMLKRMGIKPRDGLKRNPAMQSNLLQLGADIQSRILDASSSDAEIQKALEFLAKMIVARKQEIRSGKKPKKTRRLVTTEEAVQFLMSPAVIVKLIESEEFRRLLLSVANTDAMTDDRVQQLKAAAAAKILRWARTAQRLRGVAEAEPRGASQEEKKDPSPAPAPVALRVEAEAAQDAQEQVKEEQDYSEVADALVRQVLVDNVTQVAERERQLEEAAERIRIQERAEDEAKLTEAK